MKKNIYIVIVFGICAIFLSGCSFGSITKIKQTQTISTVSPYEIGTVDTAFQLLGPDHKIEIGAVPDPKISGVTCFYSRAKKGGIAGGLGLAEDTSDASVACRQTGPISFIKSIALEEEIWNESTSIFFKKLRIVRFYDKNTNSLIYLVYSDKLIDGSPKNSISAVPLDKTQALLQ